MFETVVAFAAALAALSLTGCGPSWKVLRSNGPPSALATASDVAVAFDYSKMLVEGKTEPEWVAAKTAEDANYAATWADLNSKLEGAVLEGMQKEYPSAHTGANADSVVMVVQVETFKIGKFIPFVRRPP